MGQVEGSYLVARTLKEEGVDTLFYLMGGPNYEIINNSEDLGIRTVDFRHEQAAAMAAHGYTRVTGKPGVTTAASGSRHAELADRTVQRLRRLRTHGDAGRRRADFGLRPRGIPGD